MSVYDSNKVILSYLRLHHCSLGGCMAAKTLGIWTISAISKSKVLYIHMQLLNISFLHMSIVPDSYMEQTLNQSYSFTIIPLHSVSTPETIGDNSLYSPIGRLL